MNKIIEIENPDLILSSYDYSLPEKLIAQKPTKLRDQSRLLVYDVKKDVITHDIFSNLDHYLESESNLVLNDTKVFPARLFGAKKTGGKIEVLLLTPSPDDRGYFEAMIKSSGKKNIGDLFYLNNGNIEVEICDKADSTFFIRFNQFKLTEQYLNENATIPIPPYIRDGKADHDDFSRYQTVYANRSGAVAAPTAGLHFTDNVFNKLDQLSINKLFVTLNVGPGTFKPVSTDIITDHQMHSELYSVKENVLNQLNINLNNKKKNYAVGTTSLRVLASIYNKEKNKFSCNENLNSTNIFLHPPYQIDYIDGLITNFHLPKSSLLMLVSCLIGRKKLLDIYSEAIKNNYRFYSYGDSMFIKL